MTKEPAKYRVATPAIPTQASLTRKRHDTIKAAARVYWLEPLLHWVRAVDENDPSTWGYPVEEEPMPRQEWLNWSTDAMRGLRVQSVAERVLRESLVEGVRHGLGRELKPGEQARILTNFEEAWRRYSG